MAYAVGHDGSRPVVTRFNGASWSLDPIAASVPNGELTSVTIHGTEAWSIGALRTLR